MRLNIGTKFVTAEECIAAKKRVALALEVKILRQPIHFITALFHPFREKRLLARALLMAKITGDKFAANGQSGVGRENHIWKSVLRWNQMNVALEIRELRMQLFPLLLHQSCVGAAGAVHPGVDRVLNAA